MNEKDLINILKSCYKDMTLIDFIKAEDKIDDIYGNYFELKNKFICPSNIFPFLDCKNQQKTCKDCLKTYCDKNNIIFKMECDNMNDTDRIYTKNLEDKIAKLTYQLKEKERENQHLRSDLSECIKMFYDFDKSIKKYKSYLDIEW